MSSYQSYTIRQLDGQEPNIPDTDQLAAGVCNFLKGTRQHAMPVSEFMDRVFNSDDHIEGSLSTVFPVLVSASQWRCSAWVREYGPPTLFLIPSCAEYNSLEIATYLRKVNDGSDLCVEKIFSEISRLLPDSYPQRKGTG